MTYEDKLAFVRKHIGDEVEFSDSKDFIDPEICQLGGINPHGYFIDEDECVWLYCRPITKKKLIPWTLETAESVQLRHKRSGIKVWMNYGLMITWYHDGEFTTRQAYGSLLTDWETVDGRPCGTEVVE